MWFALLVYIIFLPSLPLRYPVLNPPLLNICIRTSLSFGSTKYSSSLCAKSMYFLYIDVTIPTYSGDFILPSIFNDFTPEFISSGNMSKVHTSFELKRYPLSTVSPLFNREYGNLHVPAHFPLLPLLPPIILLIKH